MIYEFVEPDSPIRQGDIFRGVPRVDVSLSTVVALSRKNDVITTDWRSALEDSELVERGLKNVPIIRAVLPVSSVDAIIISQDCDAVRDEGLSLCEIAELPDVWKMAKDANGPQWYAKMIGKQGTDLLKLFYLPEENANSIVVGFDKKMGVDFSEVFRIQREELEALKSLRRGRLIKEAYEHFREKLAQYFRRYPVDPWYPLNADEFEHYAKGGGSPERRAWQEKAS